MSQSSPEGIILEKGSKLESAKLSVNGKEVLDLMQQNLNRGKCPKCGSVEIPAMSPRTFYECGSSDYDQRPGTFVQSDVCKTITNGKQ